MEDVIFCWSGGKDSTLALHRVLEEKKYNPLVLISTLTEGYDRISMHGVRRDLLEAQARSIGMELEQVFIPKEASNEIYEDRMNAVYLKWKSERINTVLYGDIFLEDLRRYRDDNLLRLGMKGAYPLWLQNTDQLSLEFIDLGYKAKIACVDTQALDESFAGRDYDIDFLQDIPADVDPCGENGEFHSFVYEGPILTSPIPVETGPLEKRDRFVFADIMPGSATDPPSL